MRKVSFIPAVVLMFLCLSVGNAGEIEVLMDKLVEKGVFDPLEASVIIDEAQQQQAMDAAKGASKSMPGWIQMKKIKGDVRLRYQTERKDMDERRDRIRVRYRMGIEADAYGGFGMGAGLATGETDSRSTNQTLEDNFSTKSIQLDYAYITYMSSHLVSFIGGKYGIKKAIWCSDDLLWDSDISVEGLNATLHHAIGAVNLDVNGGYWILDEFKKASNSQMDDRHDPYMIAIQPLFTYKWGEDFVHGLKIAPQYYAFSRVKDELPLPNSEGGNTLVTNSAGKDVLKYDYDSIGISADIGYTTSIIPFINWIGAYGNYIKNNDPDKENVGYLAGIKFGDAKIKSAGQWQAKYSNRQLEADAWLDTYPDSDSYSGSTNIKGHEIVFNYGLAKNVTLGIDWYQMQPKTGTNPRTQKILQTDVIVKF